MEHNISNATSVSAAGPYPNLTWIYCDNLAGDDYVWSLLGDPGCLTGLIDSPNSWVQKLPVPVGPDGLPKDEPVLAADFSINMSWGQHKIPGGIRGSSEALEIHVQITGVSGTGIVQVTASMGAIDGQVGLLPFDLVQGNFETIGQYDLAPYWTALLSRLVGQYKKDQPTDPLFHIIDAKSNGTWFGHFCVFDKSWVEDPIQPISRSQWVMAYLVWRLADPSAYGQFLQALLKETNLLPGALPEGDANFGADENTTFTYTSSQKSDAQVCDIVTGYVDYSTKPPTYYTQDGIVKDYK